MYFKSEDKLKEYLLNLWAELYLHFNDDNVENMYCTANNIRLESMDSMDLKEKVDEIIKAIPERNEKNDEIDEVTEKVLKLVYGD